MAIHPLRISKVNTGLQIALVALVLGLDAAGLVFEPLRTGMIFLVAASTLYSGAAYIRRTAGAA